jgi:hypothetical protein
MFGQETSKASSIFTALAGGTITGLLTYVTCRSFKVPGNKAAGISVAIGLMTLVGHFTNNLLRAKAQAVVATVKAS